MGKTIQLMLLLCINATFISAQKINTHIISHENLHNKNEIWEMMELGIFSYEVDLIYFNDDLYVTTTIADSINDSTPTFHDAYLFPLYESQKKNTNLVDSTKESYFILNIHNEIIKSNHRLHQIIRSMQGFITHYNGSLHQGKIKLLVKNKHIKEEIGKEEFCGLELVGDINDINSAIEAYQMPLIEIDFEELTTWSGNGNIPFPDFLKIKQLVSKIHQAGKELSIKNCPNHRDAWDVLISLKVDFINTNNPITLGQYLKKAKE